MGGEGAAYSIPNLKPGGQNFSEQPVPSIANGPMEHVFPMPGFAAVPMMPAPVPMYQVLHLNVLNPRAVGLRFSSAHFPALTLSPLAQNTRVSQVHPVHMGSSDIQPMFNTSARQTITPSLSIRY